MTWRCAANHRVTHIFAQGLNIGQQARGGYSVIVQAMIGIRRQHGRVYPMTPVWLWDQWVGPVLLAYIGGTPDGERNREGCQHPTQPDHKRKVENRRTYKRTTGGYSVVHQEHFAFKNQAASGLGALFTRHFLFLSVWAPNWYAASSSEIYIYFCPVLFTLAELPGGAQNPHYSYSRHEKKKQQRT